MKKKIVVIGGGTGTYTVLSGLKKYPVDLSAIVSMMDDGGSNKIIRDEFGLLPTSDIRQCMLALASQESSEVLRKLFTYRFINGVGISGMTFGNLFMAALADIYSSQKKALEKTCEILGVMGNIIPVTYDKAHLLAHYENGKKVLGEHNIDEPNIRQGKFRIFNLEIVPKARANPEAVRAIVTADMVVLGPGDLFTSVLCNVMVPGIRKAIKKSKGKKVFVMNLMTKFGQTNNFSARNFLYEIEKYLGEHVLNFVLVNKSKAFSKSALSRYIKERAMPVKDDIRGNRVKVVRADFTSYKIHTKVKSDKLNRSLIRHDPDKLAKILFSLL